MWLGSSTSGTPRIAARWSNNSVSRRLPSTPDRAGQPVQITVGIQRRQDGTPRVCLECWDQAQPSSLLTSTTLPIEHFTWMVADAANALDGQEECKIRIGALPRGSPLVQAFAAPQDQDEALVLTEQPAEITLPKADMFTTRPLGPHRVLKQRGTWLKAVFTPDTFAELKQAASQPGLETEVGFFGSVRVHLGGDGACRVVIDRLYQSPAEADKLSMKISGAQVYQMHRQVERLGAWVHTHPTQVGNLVLTPTPSAPDIAVAVQVAGITRLPVVFPIAMSPLETEDNLDAFGFENNLFCSLDLEVLT